VEGSLHNASRSLAICLAYLPYSRSCKVDRPITDGLNTYLHLDAGNGVSLEKIDKFCYLGYILDTDRGIGCDSAVTASQSDCLEKNFVNTYPF